MVASRECQGSVGMFLGGALLARSWAVGEVATKLVRRDLLTTELDGMSEAWQLRRLMDHL